MVDTSDNAAGELGLRDTTMSRSVQTRLGKEVPLSADERLIAEQLPLGGVSRRCNTSSARPLHSTPQTFESSADEGA